MCFNNNVCEKELFFFFSTTHIMKATPQNKNRGLNCANSSVRPKIRDIIVLLCLIRSHLYSSLSTLRKM